MGQCNFHAGQIPVIQKSDSNYLCMMEIKTTKRHEHTGSPRCEKELRQSAGVGCSLLGWILVNSDSMQFDETCDTSFANLITRQKGANAYVSIQGRNKLQSLRRTKPATVVTPLHGIRGLILTGGGGRFARGTEGGQVHGTQPMESALKHLGGERSASPREKALDVGSGGIWLLLRPRSLASRRCRRYTRPEQW